MRSHALSFFPARRTSVALLLLALIGAYSTYAAVPSSAAKTPSAQATFVDYAQCQNGAQPSTSLACPDGWANGILNNANSHYAEDEVTPQRAEVKVAKGSAATGRTLQFTYQTRKGSSNSHAYDSLATWNFTQTQADRCQQLGNKCPVPPSNSAPTSTFPIPADPTVVVPFASGVDGHTSAHQLPGQVYTMYGGVITAASVPTHDNAANAGTDDYATVTVTYRVADTNNDGKADADTLVQFLFGGHLALGTGGWGTGLGSGSISGGPYHIKFSGTDGASIGNRDNQIMSGAIGTVSPTFSITKDAQPNPVDAGGTVTYTITVTNTSSVSGSTSFTDVYDPSVTILSVPAGCTNNTATHSMTCTTGDIAPGGNQVFQYTAQMPESFTGAPGGNGCSSTQYPVSNTATLAGGGSATETVCVNASPSFTIVKGASPETASPGQTVTYTLTVTNTGSAPGSTTFVDDYDDRVTILTVPAGCTDDTPAAGQMTCTTGTINPGDNQVFTYTAQMPATFSGPTGEAPCSSTQYRVQNTATLANGLSSTANVCVDASPSFIVSKSADPATTTPGGTVTYTITVTNNGSAPGSTTYTDVYDENITDVTTPDGCVNDPATHSMTCTTGELAAGGGSQQFVYTANMPESFTGTPGGFGCSSSDPQQFPVRNTVTLANGQSATATVCVTAEPAWDVEKSASPTTVDQGGEVTYTITVTNTGTGPGSTTVTDTYDPRATIVESSLPEGCTNDADAHQVTCTTGTVNPGDSVEFQYKATMPSNLTGPAGGSGCSDSQYPLSNTATVPGDSSSATVCVRVAHLTVSKTACPTIAVPGGILTYTITYGNDGEATAHDVTLTDTTPTGTTVVDAGGGTVGSSGDRQTVTWSIGDLEAGASGTKTILVSVPASADGTSIVNDVELTASDAATATGSLTTQVSNSGAAATGRAYGVSASLLNGLIEQPPTPDTDVENPDELLSLDVPMTDPAVSVGLLQVVTTPPESRISSNSAHADSIATTGHVQINIGDITISADTIVARASSFANSGTASSTRSGSLVQNLVITDASGTRTFEAVTSPITVDVAAGGLTGAVHVLETTTTGAANGEPQPVDSLFSSGIAVNGLHVSLTGLDLDSDVVVAHADSSAAYPSGLPCDASAPSVRGDAYVAQLLNVEPPLGGAQIGLVTLGSTGGNENGAVANLSPLGAGAGLTHTEGTLVPLFASSYATGADLNLLGGAITSTTLKAESATSGSTSSGTTTIEDLVIGGTDVCAELNLESICTPAPNMVLVLPDIATIVVLNEQIEGDRELRVNAVHIYVIGEGNPFNLPAGAELILSSAYSGTSE